MRVWLAGRLHPPYTYHVWLRLGIVLSDWHERLSDLLRRR